MKDEPIENLIQRLGSLRWIPVAMLYVAFIASGFIQAYWPHSNVIGGIAFFMAVSGIFWVQMDARHREKPILGIALAILLFIWMLFVPIYLISTRGFRGFGWTMLHAIGLYFAMLCSFFHDAFYQVRP